MKRRATTLVTVLVVVAMLLKIVSLLVTRTIREPRDRESTRRIDLKQPKVILRPGWTAEKPIAVTNILLSDGSVQQVSITGLRAPVTNTSPFTNRLQLPILNP